MSSFDLADLSELRSAISDTNSRVDCPKFVHFQIMLTCFRPQNPHIFRRFLDKTAQLSHPFRTDVRPEASGFAFSALLQRQLVLFALRILSI
jgi:hypothetical protein